MIFLEINMLAVNEEVRTSPEWRAHCERLASEGLSYARSVAPVVSGQYRSSLSAEVGSATFGNSVPGAPAARVRANAPYSIEVEFQEPARHLTLLRTLDHLTGKG